MTVKQVNMKQVLLGTAASTVATEVVIEAFPKLRPLAPIAQGITVLFLAGSFLLWLDEKREKRLRR